MAKFTKKPVEVEAFQFSGWTSCFSYMPEWFMNQTDRQGEPADGVEWDGPGGNILYEILEPHPMIYCLITTPQGVMRTEVGDWIVREAGAVYPVKREIFEANYEPVEASQ